MKEGYLKDWMQQIKEWTIKYYLLSQNNIVYIILPPSTKIMEYTIVSP